MEEQVKTLTKKKAVLKMVQSCVILAAIVVLLFITLGEDEGESFNNLKLAIYLAQDKLVYLVGNAIAMVFLFLTLLAVTLNTVKCVKVLAKPETVVEEKWMNVLLFAWFFIGIFMFGNIVLFLYKNVPFYVALVLMIANSIYSGIIKSK